MYKNEKIFQFFANLILALLTICCVAPFLLMISASFSSESALSVYGYTFWPKEFDLSAYKYLFSSTGALLKAYSVSIRYPEKIFRAEIYLLFISFSQCCLMVV